MASLSLDRVAKTFPGPIRAVEGFSLDVEDGALVALVGPSGCGKTTVLRMIAGLEAPSRGRIALGGRDLAGVAPRDRDVAMVFENQALYPHLDVERNIAFGLRLRKMPRAQIARRVQEIAERLDIAPLLARRPATLSAGQRGRVALARALARRPKALLLDEPLANLDPRLRDRLGEQIRRVHAEERLTTLLVTHHHDEAMRLGQRVVVMRQGRIEQVGTPDELYDHPASQFVAELSAPTAINLLVGRLEQRGDGLRFRADAIVLDLPAPQLECLADRSGQPVVLGIRPEHVALVSAGGSPAERGTIPGRVEHVERLGPDTWVRVRVGAQCLTIRAGPAGSRQLAPGQGVALAFPTDRLHFFDPATGKACRPPVG
ncbi:MAG: ABC transporter ATP-binding protein [Pirellulales bacterium]|nr:ABC transporter ATP-binding protein [Pirellulales bacterium]